LMCGDVDIEIRDAKKYYILYRRYPSNQLKFIL